MKIVIFGLTVSSSWGNGHATLWRGLIAALSALGHRVVFFEHDVPYYASTRDLHALPGASLRLYDDWPTAQTAARAELADADVGMVTSFCPHGIEATRIILDAPRPLSVFYDLDTPVTLSMAASGVDLSSIGPRGLRDFDLVLSYTGGDALEALRTQLGARQVAPLYGHVDPALYRPAEAVAAFASDLSYIGTYAADRQPALEQLFITPARMRRAARFVIAGAQYPPDFPWTENIFFVRHLPPADHPSFYASSKLTLNVTRQAMARMGWCPSGRLFEATACGATVLSDHWDGLDAFFEPGREILVAATAEDTASALDRSTEDLSRIGRAARERTLAEHTSERRAIQLVERLASAMAGPRVLLNTTMTLEA